MEQVQSDTDREGMNIHCVEAKHSRDHPFAEGLLIPIGILESGVGVSPIV